MPPLVRRSPVVITLFPLVRRVGKVRDVAAKMLTKSTDRHSASYRDQVTWALAKHLSRFDISQHEKDKQIAAFWRAVDGEIARLTYRSQRPEGSDAYPPATPSPNP